jgi:hypothetical protein
VGQATGRGVAKGRGRPAALLDVAKALFEQGEHVLVVEGIEDHPALAAGADDTDVAEQS